MKKLIFAAFLLTLPIAIAATDYHWTGAGWYQVMVTQYGSALGPGPFSTKEACQSTLPASDPENYKEYECNYLDKDGLTDS